MNISVMIDIVIAVVLIAFTAAGWKHGLIRTLVGLAAMVLAVGLSSQIARAAAPEIVDRYLRPATYAAIEERAQELARGEEVSSVEDLRRDLSQVLDAIPNDFIREKAQDALDGLLPQGRPWAGRCWPLWRSWAGIWRTGCWIPWCRTCCGPSCARRCS